MPSALASEDQSMPNAAAESGENATNIDKKSIDLNDQRIRVVSKELSQPPNVNG